MSPETLPSLSIDSGFLKVSAVGPFAISALVLLVVLWFVGRLLLRRLRG